MSKLEKIRDWINRSLIYIAGSFLMAMIFLTCANICLRLFGTPVRGTFELMGFFGAISASFALGHTQMKKGHIAVDILIFKFSEKTQKILNCINNLVCTIFASILVWQLVIKATTIMENGEVSETLRIIYYPFTYGVAAGCAMLAFVFFIDLLLIFFPPPKDKSTGDIS
ncbi:TRAP transporter small permease [Desulfobacterales bacterium HSG16]|nr:TRAP transporter small permease [Desulfobacterales bacterium HSG16]